jgi:hypothetical protein
MANTNPVYESRKQFTVKLDNLDDRDGCVMATIEGPDAHLHAKDDQTIAGSRWECAGDMPELAYAMPCDHAGLVAELEAEGYDLDLSEYCPPD